MSEARSATTSLTTSHSSSAIRLIRDDAHSAAWNMAVDEAILEAVEDGIAPPTVRFYTWEAPAVSVGRFQDISRDIHLDYCERHGIPIVRRPTGGRGILHGSDLTMSITLPLASLGDHGRSVSATYRWLSAALIDGLDRLGVGAEFGRCERIRARGGDCFAARSQADILTGAGEKLIGSAQRRTRTAVVQQSSLRHQRPELDPADVFTGLALGATYPLQGLREDELIDALTASLGEQFGCAISRGSLTGWEEERAAVLCSATLCPLPSHAC